MLAHASINQHSVSVRPTIILHELFDRTSCCYETQTPFETYKTNEALSREQTNKHLSRGYQISTPSNRTVSDIKYLYFNFSDEVATNQNTCCL